MQLNQSILFLILISKKPPRPLSLHLPENPDGLLPFLPPSACQILSAFDACRTYTERLSHYRTCQTRPPIYENIFSLLSPQQFKLFQDLKSRLGDLTQGNCSSILASILPSDLSGLISDLSTLSEPDNVSRNV